jgi:Helicase associated domain
MVRFVTYPHPPMETTEMVEWERRYREVLGWIVAFGDMSALEARRPAVLPGEREGQSPGREGHDEDDLDVDHDIGLEPLREWVQEQRRLYYHRMLPEYRVTLLNHIHFRWSENDSPHQDGDDLIRANQERRALLDCPSVVTVPPEATGYDELIETSTWDTTDSAVGEINPPNESAAATAIANSAVATPTTGFTAQDLAWEERYRALCEYKKKHGNCRVPRRYKEDQSLGLWVGNQRMALKKGTMRPDRRRLLEAIGFEAVDARYTWSDKRNTERIERAWLDMYKVLLDFYATFGDTDVPKSYVCTIEGRQIALGRWVSRQRTYFAKGVIREDRQRMLDEIGFVWCTPAMVELKGPDLEPLDFRKGAAATRADDADDDSVSCGSLVSFRRQPVDRESLGHDEDGSGPTAAHPPAFVVVSPNSPRHAPLIRTDPCNGEPPVFVEGGVNKYAASSVVPPFAQLAPADRSRRSTVACLSFETQQSMISPKNSYPNECQHGESQNGTIPFPLNFTG